MTSAPISADAATTKIVGVNKTITLVKGTVTGLSKAEKKVVKVSKNSKTKKVTVKGLKAGKVSFKIGKKAYTVKVGATKVTATAAATTLKVNDTTTVAIKATNGAKDKLTVKSSQSAVVKVSKTSVTTDKNGKASITLKGLAAGTSTITVKSANTGKYAKVKITVKADETATATPSSDAPATGTPATGTPATDSPVGPTAVPTSGGAVTTAPTSGGAVTAAPTATPTTPATVATLSAVTASAISTNKIAFTFNRTVTASAIKADDVVVTETAERKFVKSVTNDKTNSNVAIIEFYDGLTTGKTYNVSVKVENQVYSLNVVYKQGDAASILVENQIVPAGAPTAIKYKVVDVNGLDITDSTTVAFTSDKQTAIDGTGKITLSSDKETAFVKVTTTLANGTTISSNQFTIRAAATVATELTNYSVGTSSVDFTATDYKQDLNVLENDYSSTLYVEIKDQFGAKVESGTTFESLDNTIAVIDKTTGVITPLKVGTVPVKISNGTFSKTVILSIVTKSTVQKLTAKDTALTIYYGLTNKTASTTLYLEDQYGKKSYTGLTANIVSGADLVSINTSTLTADGALSVTATASKTGTAVIKVTNGTFSQNIVVTLAELGTINSYDVKGIKATLDLNSQSADATKDNYNANTMNISVNPVDKDGKIAGDPADFSYIVKDATGATVINYTTAAATGTITFDGSPIVKGKTYTVTVKVGSMEVKTFQFNTVDTRKAPSVILAKSTANVAASDLASANALTTKLQNLDVLHVGTGVTLSGLDFVSADTTVLNPSDYSVGSKSGKVTIVLKSVTATENEVNYNVDLTGSIELNIKSAAETTAEEAVVAYEALAATDALDTDGEITTALTKLSSKESGTGCEAKTAVEALEAGATKTALQARITAVDNKIKAAATIATVSVENVAINTTNNSTQTLTVVCKNSAGVVLNTALTDVTYAWSVDNAQDGATGSITATTAMLALTNSNEKTATATVNNEAGEGVDAGDSWTVKVNVTQGTSTKEATATVTA